MNKRLKRLTRNNAGVFMFILALFVAATYYLYKDLLLAASGLGALVVMLILALLFRHGKKKKLKAYIESVTYETENARSNTLINFPLPIAVFRLEDSRIIWGNEMFFSMCGAGGSRLDACIADLVPGFSSKWLLEGKNKYSSLISVNGRKYQLHGNIIRSSEDNSDSSFMGITYWVDVTDYDDTRIEFENSRPIVGIIIIDNLDELYRNQPERARNDIRDNIEDKLNQWGEKNKAIIRRYERDRYILVFERRYFEEMKGSKFDIVESVHEVENPIGINASISIGLGEDTSGFAEGLQFATNAAEIALSRGGDQVVIKNKFGFEFFGGRGNEVEKRTKVKSRVMANALAELIKDSSKVYIMGHRLADLDAVGAAAGLVCFARKCGVKSEIVINKDSNVAGTLIDRLRLEEEYKNIFISPREALLRADARTLLVVVDTNRPEQAEDMDILTACNRTVVIDHHRVAATYIQNAALSFIEPYASSTSELISELLQELVERQDILVCEAEAMLAGMVLDTKSFTIRTGERTFEAAAYLKRAGADTAEVKKLLQSDMDTTLARYNILRSAELYKNIALAAPRETQSRIVAAQAADELLNIAGVDASIVMAPDGKGGVFASARSIGEVNVQILMEKLGGGGNKGIAAVQIKDIDVDELYRRVTAAIDDYFETE